MNGPLVSVPVITYNSAKYIIDGLESVKAQTYKNIELIISDDCSTDNTVELCRDWLEKNKSRFKRTLLVTTEKNTGVAGNCNRAIRPCQGEWIKILSGDDQFFPFSIEKYVEYSLTINDAEIIFGKLHFYGPDRELVLKTKEWYENDLYPKIRRSQKEQYKENLISLFVPGPGIFFKRQLWEKIRGFDEKYPFCEEDPFMFKIFKSGKRVYFLENETYKYLVTEESLGRFVEKSKINRPIRDRIRFFYDTRRMEMLKNGLIIPAIKETLLYKTLINEEKGNLFKYWIFKFILKSLSIF